MKKLILILIALLLVNISSLAQAPEKFKYQAHIIDQKGSVVNNTTIGLQLSIYQNSLNGNLVYQEIYTTTTGKSGLVDLQIGMGNATIGIFSEINWGIGPYFLETAVDLKGGTNYVNVGASQLLSVPYALYAKQAQSVDGDNDTDPTNEIELPEIANENDLLFFDGSSWVALANPDGDPTNEIELPEEAIENDLLTWNGTAWVAQAPVVTSLESLLIENNDGGHNQIKNITDPTEAQDVATKGYVDVLETKLTALEERIVALEQNNSSVDDDQDGFTIGEGDCDDDNPNINPNVTEICGNGIDDNCDGEIDEDCGPTVTTVITATGKIWMDRNLGATQVATSSSDADSYGDFYQWGRATTDFTPVSSYPYDWSSPQNNNLWQGVNGANNPCPDGFRIPTETEWNAERQRWSSNNAAGALESPLKLPMAGNRYYSNGSVSSAGSYGRYWSSTVSGSDSSYLFFDSGGANVFTLYRANGFSVRCLKD